MSKDFRVLIVGGGVGGLTAAAAVKQAGMDPVVFERRPSLEATAVGAGVHLWSNALVGLHQLGIADQVAAGGVRVHAHRYRTWRERRIGDLPVGSLSARIGAPTVGVSRPDLHGCLMSLLGEDDVRFDSEVVGFEQNTKRAILRFADGSSEEGDVLVGADGLHSVIRRQIHGPAKPQYSGLTGWRAVCDFQHARVIPGEMVIYWGRGARILYYYVQPGRLYWLALVKTAPDTPDTPGHRKGTVVGLFDGWPAHVLEMIEATEEQSILRTDINDRDPLSHWGRHRVTLLGDAAHPMSPDMAQGAGQAIEDGIALAAGLGRDPGPQNGLRSYEERRMKRANGFVSTSRAVARMGGLASPPLCAVRDRAILPTIYGTQRFGPAITNMTPVW